MTGTPVVAMRSACEPDGPALSQIDRQTRSAKVSPSPDPMPRAAFFSDECPPGDHLVATVEGEIVGYVAWERPSMLASNRHVMHISGLAVTPDQQGRGIGRALLEAAIAELTSRGVTKIGLRVLAGNGSALALYRSCGFETEGVLAGEFVLDGEPVDDVLMAHWP